MISDWLLRIVGSLFGIRDRGFFVAPSLRGKPLRSVAHPPTPPAESWTDFFGWGLVQRLVYSLNKFRANLSPIPKYSLQIIQFIVLLFQIVNL